MMLMASLKALLDNPWFQRFIIATILVNAAILGAMATNVSPGTAHVLHIADMVCLAIFVGELTLKFIVLRGAMFRDPWNIFDIIVVGIALLPASGPLSVLRALRVLRLMRLVTVIPSMRRVVTGMFAAIPGGASVAAVLLVMYYVAAIIAVNLFKTASPQHFGDLGTTFFTLFKMMTLEGWPDIADDVLVNAPYAWIFFVIFIIFTTFTTLNLLFGIIVDAMNQTREEEKQAELADAPPPTNAEIAAKLSAVETELAALRRALTAKD
ncbi:MAG: ion transporter [Sphingopyxis sp.]|nr:ion transporter [Sphingopyxis sp.]